MVQSFEPTRHDRRHSPLNLAALMFSALALVLAGFAVLREPSLPHSATTVDRLDSVRTAGTLRVGYGGYPPYTIAGSSGAAPTGFSVDLVNAIASRASPPLKVEWHQFSFDTMKADLAADRFDFIADPVFMTVPRAQDFNFTVPYSYFGIAVGLVRADDNRFTYFSDLNREGITIVLAEGWTSSEYARANLSKPTLKSIPVTGEATSQLDEVLAGRADVALNDVPSVVQYARAHSGKVKALWLHAPPSSVAGGFVLRPGDSKLRDFLSTSIQILQTDGTIDVIDRKWKSLGFFPELTLNPGSGIAGTVAASVATR